MTTLKNKAKAMNQVHKFCKSIVLDCAKLFPLNDGSMYKTDGTLNKKITEQLKEIFSLNGSDKLNRITIDDSHNSVSVQVEQRYNVIGMDGNYSSTLYYKYHVYLVCKHENSNSDRHIINKPIPHDGILELSTNWTERKLISYKKRVEKLDEMINKLNSEKSQLNFWLRD